MMNRKYEEEQTELQKRIDEITGEANTRNIIYPILDVLNKAAEKLGTNKVVIDAVILNGGMSKFYMVVDRLKKFFGFDPIVVIDPDQAVARGAAVYHYYLHKYEEIKDNMRMVGDVTSARSEADKKFESSRRCRSSGGATFSTTVYIWRRKTIRRSK